MRIVVLAGGTSTERDVSISSGLLVAAALRELAKGRTTLTVAHRLSTIRDSDKIYVLTEKGIEEEGNHEQLLMANGIYARLYRLAERMK